MQKTIIVLIIIVILVAAGLGVYLLITGTAGTGTTTPNQTATTNTNTTAQGPTDFMIQGMHVQVTKQGTGAGAKMGDSLVVDYVGKFADGKEFDSTLKRKIPFPFNLNDNNHLPVKGWNLGVVGMKVGEQRTLTIPPELAFGKDGFLSIPKNATLTYEITLLKLTPGK